MKNGADERGILNEGEILGRNFPLGKRGSSIILRQDLDVSPGRGDQGDGMVLMEKEMLPRSNPLIAKSLEKA
ncbi:MAG TPA: hypothetical protein VMV04_14840 [Thermodesulfobacteriota bacterium]|nr:hypothetical protein [Thermodesulfobacteriota bacterium]